MTAAAPFLGVLMLRTRFPRPVGDIGNPATWPMPVRYRTVERATVDRIVTAGPLPEEVLEAFVEAGTALAAEGAVLLTTSCGFLAPWHARLSARLPVPIVTSSLEQVARVQAGLPAGRRVGVITIDGDRLTADHLAAVGADPRTPWVGLERGRELHRVVLGDLPALDEAAAARDLVDAGLALRRRVPALGAVVLECTNLPPYRAALGRALALPVHDIVTLVMARYAALTGASLPAEGSQTK